MREISLDTETTGLNPAEGHRIIEIGCVEMINRVRTGEIFHVYINPEREIPEDAFRIHGLTREFLKDKPLFSDIKEDFLEFIGESPLVIHNAPFDLKFLNAELYKLQGVQIEFNRAVDTLIMARRKFPGSPASLDALCKRFKIDLSSRTKHGALLDAELLADVYLELMGGSQDSFRLDSGLEGKKNYEENKEEEIRILSAREYAPTDEETKAHKEFIEKMIKNALWDKVGA